MFWDVKDNEVKNQFRFYSFLKRYIEYNGGNNEEVGTVAYKDFKAVIDGQQRLNSLYIGIKGSYAERKYKYHKKVYHKDENDYPTKKLYLDILNPLINDEEKKLYDFQLLINNEHVKENISTTKPFTDEKGNIQYIECFWFEVGKILEFNDINDIVLYLNTENLNIGGFPGKTLMNLYKLINETAIINYYLEQEQDFDKILFEFIRTNMGGTKLTFANLLMSIITASWEKGNSIKGAREELDNIVREIGDIGFVVDEDFILKSCLVLVSNDIRFALKNFSADTVRKIMDEWGIITKCIKESFQLVKSLSFNNQSLRAKNSIIPIIYYLYFSHNYDDINKDNKHQINKQFIKQYLHISLLNKLFGGSSDGFLVKLRNVILENKNNDFPLYSFKELFKGTNRSFHIDDERVNTILRTSYDDLDSFYILSLLFPKFNFDFKNPNIDHLHPKSQFVETNYLSFSDEKKEFYKNHFNSVLNLSLLSEEQNKSKNKSELKGWVETQENTNKGIRNAILIPENMDLSFANFENFIIGREKILMEIIKANTEIIGNN